MEKVTIYDYARMCRTYDTLGCYYCPLSHCNNGLNQVCGDLTKKHPDKANEIILNWCKEHPVETRQDRFLEMFPNAKKDSDGIIKILPCSLEENIVTTMPSTCSYIHGSCNECRKEYWLAEVDEHDK